MKQIIKNLVDPEKRRRIRSEKKSKRTKEARFEIICNTCTICKKETKELILCEECKAALG